MNSQELEIVTEEEVPKDLRMAIASDAPDFEEIILSRKKLLAKVEKFDPVESVDDTPRMEEAGRLRKDLVKCRTGLERIRKAAGESARRRVDAINEMFRTWREDNESAEAFLKENEEFGIRYEASRKAEIAAERAPQLLALGLNPDVYNLGEMTTHQWEITLAGAKAAKEQSDREVEEADRKAEEERLAGEKERQRLAEENRLLNEQRKQEQAAAEEQRRKDGEALRAQQEKAKKDAQAAQAKLDEERRERERLEAAERDRLRAEAEKVEADKKAKAKAARAPDKAKLKAYLQSVLAAVESVPKVKEEAELMLQTFVMKVTDIGGEFEKKIESL